MGSVQRQHRPRRRIRCLLLADPRARSRCTSRSQKLNAIVQDEYHGGLKRTARTRWGVKFGGTKQITAMDKVMQIANDRLEGYRVATREKEKIGVFNGQLGTVRGEWPSAAKQYRKANERGGVKLINVDFDGQPGVRFSYADSGWNGWTGICNSPTRSPSTRARGASSATCSSSSRAWPVTS